MDLHRVRIETNKKFYFTLYLDDKKVVGVTRVQIDWEAGTWPIVTLSILGSGVDVNGLPILPPADTAEREPAERV